MEERGEDRDSEIPNSRMSYNPLQIIQESQVKLPLAPIQDRRPIATRRGISIFSPTQTLDYRHRHPVNPPPLLPPQGPTPDPDPTDSKPPPSPPPPPASSIRYRECLKNHAASMGSHVVDGCGEFMPGGEEGTSEAMRCAACDCHRNFHRKEAEGHAPPSNRITPPSKHPHYGPAMVNFGGAADESSSEDLNNNTNNNNVLQYSSGGQRGSKKRFRTKFSHEQKERMQELAEKIGWRIQKQDEEEVNKFCHESGVKRQVFKVWMHNNKQALKKRQAGL